MTENVHLSQAVDDFFSNAQNGWFTPITEACRGLSAVQAAQSPAAGFNSVWAIVKHVACCTETVVCHFEGREQDRSAPGMSEDWPVITNTESEEDWLADQARALAINQKLAACVASMDDEELDSPIFPGKAERWKAIQGVIAHNGYHACEIISVRHMLGYWLERT
jgi:hypothetical protein